MRGRFEVSSRTVSQARAGLYRLLDEVAESHEPILITGKRSNGVLISEEDWKSLEESLYLSSMPGVRASIIKGLKTPLSRCAKKLKW